MAGAPLELIAVEVRADLDQLQAQMPAAARVVDQSMDQVGRSLVRAEQQAVRSSAVIGRSFDQASMRSRMLGYQISDIGTQLASGQSPFLIIAQQAPQVANALEGVTGVAGRLAAFFSGPWGAALLAAASVAGVLIGKLWETEDAADSAAGAANRLTQAMSNLASFEFDSDDLTAVTKRMLELEGKAAALRRQAEQAGAGRGAGGRFYQQQAQEAAREAAALRQQLADATNPRNPIRQLVERNRALGDGTPASAARSAGGGRSDAQRAADQAAREAERLREQQEREAKALDERYGKTLAQLGLDRQLAELRDRGTDAAKQEADILEANFRIEQQFPELAQSTAMADQLRLQLLKQIAAATIEEAYGRKASKDALDAWFETAEKRHADLAREREKTERELGRRQEEQIRTLASLYHDAFTGGTQAIWDDFKETGLAVIAEVLARFTLSQLGGAGAGGGFDLGSAFSAAIGSVLPGFASGGSMRIGGHGGVDRNVLSLNGRPIAKVSAEETLNVTNPALSRSGGAGPSVMVSQTYDMRGSMVSERVYEDIDRISKINAAEAGARAYRDSLRDAPGAIRGAHRYGPR